MKLLQQLAYEKSISHKLSDDALVCAIQKQLTQLLLLCELDFQSLIPLGQRFDTPKKSGVLDAIKVPGC